MAEGERAWWCRQRGTLSSVRLSWIRWRKGWRRQICAVDSGEKTRAGAPGVRL